MSMKFTFQGVFEDWPKELQSGQACVLLWEYSDQATIRSHWISAAFSCDTNIVLNFAQFSLTEVGIWQMKAVLFIRPDGKDQFYAYSPKHFGEQYIQLDADGRYCGHQSAPESFADGLRKWENRMTIGAPNSLGFNGHRQAMFVCSDALVTHAARIGPAEIYPLARQETYDLAAAVRESMRTIGMHARPLVEIKEAIAKETSRRSPMFLLRFPRILFPPDDATLSLMPHIKRIFGILCLERQSYARIAAGFLVDTDYDKGNQLTFYPFNMNSYYRGNLVGGFSAAHDCEKWDKYYAKISHSGFLTELVNKTNAAFSEVDLDLAVFKFWSILEAVAFHRYRRKKLTDVTALVRDYYLPANAENSVALKVGSHEFGFNDLLSLWLNWRDITAHNGGLVAFHDGIVKICPQLRELMRLSQENNILWEYGDERSLFVLKDVVATVVKRHVSV